MIGENSRIGEQQYDEQYQQLRQKAKKAEVKVMTKNIYRRGVFESLVEVADAVQQIANQQHKDFEQVLQEVGIQNPSTVFDRSISHWGQMLQASSIPSEQQLIDNLRNNFQLQLVHASEVFIPTDQLEPTHGDSGESHEIGDDVNRVSLAIETLLNMQLNNQAITLDDFEVILGRVPEHGWRTRPYWVINIKKHKIAVFLNNQHGNRTFVLGYKSRKALGEIATYTKEQLKTLSVEPGSLIHHFIFDDAARFKDELAITIRRVHEGKEMPRCYAVYEEARSSVRSLGIKSRDDYRKRYKEDPRLPAAPNVKYGESFLNWMDFLGTDNKSGPERAQEFYRTYEEAGTAARALKIKSLSEYCTRYKEDPRLPAAPGRTYGSAFVNWMDFLGTDNKSGPERAQELYRTYEEAKAAVRTLEIKKEPEYRVRYKEDPRLPAAPDRTYGSAFVSWMDFLGNRNINRTERAKEVYQTYEEARTAARALKIKSLSEYHTRYKEDPRLPSTPNRDYGETFVSWLDFLGTENKSNLERSMEIYQAYEEAKAAVKVLGITTSTVYKERYREDPRLPSTPERKYGDAFVSWPDFLGKIMHG